VREERLFRDHGHVSDRFRIFVGMYLRAKNQFYQALIRPTTLRTDKQRPNLAVRDSEGSAFFTTKSAGDVNLPFDHGSPQCPGCGPRPNVRHGATFRFTPRVKADTAS